MKLLTRTLFVVILIVFTFALIVAGNYATLPTHNTTQAHFDTIIVLGTPAKSDGTKPQASCRLRSGARAAPSVPNPARSSGGCSDSA